jgi:hypothetical protein
MQAHSIQWQIWAQAQGDLVRVCPGMSIVDDFSAGSKEAVIGSL